MATPTILLVGSRLNGALLQTSRGSRWSHVVSTVRFVCPNIGITCVVCLLTLSSCFTGELPKQLPVSHEVLDLGVDTFNKVDNNNKFTGGIPSEWGALTNLKRLSAVKCGLDGAICMPRTKFAHFGHTYNEFCVLLHSDRRREDGAQGETSQD